ncbi:MAG: MFS transporter [Desulfuromonadales bacterium]
MRRERTSMLYTRAFIALFIANFTTVASFTAFFLFPLFIIDHGGGQDDVGIIMGIFALASALCRPWISEMIDRFGRKRSYTLGCVIMTAMPLCYLPLSGHLDDFYAILLVIRILHGIGLAICFTSVFTFIADLIPADRLNEGIGMFGISGLVGMAAGPALAEPILQHFGYATYLVTASILAGISLILHLPLKDLYVLDHTQAKISFFTLLGRRKLAVVGLLSMIFGICVAATGNFVAPLAEVRGIDFVSRFYIAYSLTAILIRFAGGRIADVRGEFQLLPFALTISAAGLFLLSVASGGWTLILAGVLAGCGHGLLFPTLNALAIRDEPAPIRGKITGIFTGGIDTGIFIGSLTLGYLAEHFGLTALFLTAGLAVLAGLGIRRFWSPPV